VKAPADKITQGYRFFMSGEQISNPEFQAQSVQDWMAERAPEGYKLTINGTFYAFDAGSSVHRSAFPFFSRDPVTDVSLLPSVGKDPATEQFRDWRRCISWQRGTRSRVQDGPWTLGTNDFYDIMDRITIPGGPCLVTASGTGETSHGEFVVGFDPRLEVDADSREGPMNTLTLVGVTTHGNGMWNTENLCFLIGGWHTRNNASNMMQEDFGCKPVLQLDGGRSTQFSYVSPQDGRTIVNPIDGCCLLSKRPVPHVLMIR
jgi:hypothetical protein